MSTIIYREDIMQEALNNIAQELCEGETSIEKIRESARNIFDFSSCNFDGYLLKSAMRLCESIIQFANDLESPTDK
jgi:hypothetical protein